jgi:adenylate cyclase
MAWLRIITGPDHGTEIEILNPHFTIGRAVQSDLCIPDPSISRLHASVVTEKDSFRIVDQNSNNGVLVNEIKSLSMPLADQDILTLGSSQLQFFLKKPSQTTSSSGVLFTSDPSEYDLDKSIVMDVEDIEQLKKRWAGESADKTKIHDHQKNYRKLQAMLKVSSAVANLFDLQELINELMNVIFTETNASRGFIMLYNDTHTLVPVVVKKHQSTDEDISVSSTLINIVVQQKKAILSSDLLNDARFDIGQSIIANQIRSCMVAPLSYQNEILGIIHLDSNLITTVFTQDDLELLIAIANQAAVCIKNTHLVKKITEEENKRSKLAQYFPPEQVALLMKDQLQITLGGKTEEVSILFCDIRRFTKISEGMLAEDVMDFLNDFFSVMTEIIFRNAGMVDNFMGDCILAVFGGPFLNERHQECAVLAAIEMQKAQTELNKRFEQEGRKTFQVGIGIHSGKVSRGNIGSTQLKKYTVIGSNVNVCSRLCSIAKPGQILVSASTRQALPPSIQTEELDPVMVKNVSEILIPYRVNY